VDGVCVHGSDSTIRPASQAASMMAFTQEH